MKFLIKGSMLEEEPRVKPVLLLNPLVSEDVARGAKADKRQHFLMAALRKDVWSSVPEGRMCLCPVLLRPVRVSPQEHHTSSWPTP